MAEQNKQETYFTDDKSMRSILVLFTAIFIIIGILIIWKGVTAAIPQAGWGYGVWFLVAGVFFIAVGVGLFFFLRSQGKKRAARDAKLKEQA